MEKLETGRNEFGGVWMKLSAADHERIIETPLRRSSEISQDIEEKMRAKYGDLDFHYVRFVCKTHHMESFWLNLFTKYDLRKRLAFFDYDFLAYEIDFGNLTKEIVHMMIEEIFSHNKKLYEIINEERFQMVAINKMLIDEIIEANPKQVESARKNSKAIGWFVGQYMQKEHADARLVKSAFEGALHD